MGVIVIDLQRRRHPNLTLAPSPTDADLPADHIAKRFSDLQDRGRLSIVGRVS